MERRHIRWLIGTMIMWCVVMVGYQFVSIDNRDRIQQQELKQETVIIPAVFLCDESTQNMSNKDLVDGFNEKYAGKYFIDVEWYVGNAADYRARLKMLNSVNELPAIITDVGFDQAFYKLLVENEQIIDLGPYYRSDTEWQAYLSNSVIDSVAETNGKIYLMPLETTYYCGIFWNKELFAKAGITKFPETWDEFWETCDQLKAHNITPLSLHTDGTSWASMLLATSYMGTSQEGISFMKEVFPKSYDNGAFREMMGIYKKAFEYTADDAIGSDFDIAEKHFYNEETAMIPNGRWMIENLSTYIEAKRNFDKHVSFSTFPNNVVIGSTAMSGWAVSSHYSKQVQEGQLLF